MIIAASGNSAPHFHPVSGSGFQLASDTSDKFGFLAEHLSTGTAAFLTTWANGYVADHQDNEMRWGLVNLGLSAGLFLLSGPVAIPVFAGLIIASELTKQAVTYAAYAWDSDPNGRDREEEILSWIGSGINIVLAGVALGQTFGPPAALSELSRIRIAMRVIFPHAAVPSKGIKAYLPWLITGVEAGTSIWAAAERGANKGDAFSMGGISAATAMLLAMEII